MRHPGHPDKLLEVLGDELRTVVRDDARPGFGEFFLRPLNDDFYVGLSHLFANLPVNNIAAASVKQATQVVKCSSDVEIRNIHMPMLMGQQWLDKTCTLFAGLVIPSFQKSGFGKHAPCAGRADSNKITVQHHKREPPVALQGVLQVKVNDGLPLPLLQPEIPGDEGVMFVDFPTTLNPAVEFTFTDGQPNNKSPKVDAGLFAPRLDEVHHGVSCVMGHPDTG